MGDCSEIYGCRPDGGQGLSGRTTVGLEFLRFSLKIFPVWEPRSDGCTSAASNFHIRLCTSGPRGMAVRTVNLQHAISISYERASGPWYVGVQTVEVEYVISLPDARASGPSWLSFGRMYLNCDSCLMYERVRTGIHVVWTVASIFPYLNLERIWSWSIIGRHPDGLLSRPDGCKLTQKLLDTVKGLDGNKRRLDGWCLICLASGRYGTSFGRKEQWTDERPDRRNSGQMSVRTGWHGHPDGWQGTENLLTCKQNLLKYFWIVESLLKHHLYKQVILSKQNVANHKLTQLLHAQEKLGRYIVINSQSYLSIVN
jgi:hypothetical protein